MYVLGSIDRTMMTGTIDPDLKHNVIGAPEMGEIVARIDALYYKPNARGVLVQQMLAIALVQIAQSAQEP